jgi:hypothetical protein
MRWVGHVARVGEKRRVLVGKREGKRPLLRPSRQRREGNIKMGLQEVGLGGGMGWFDVVQDRDRWWALVNAVMNLRRA